MKKERQLTSSEKKRKENFEKTCREMERKGYLKRDLTVGVLQANVMAVIIMLPFAAFFLAMYLVSGGSSSEDFSLIVFLTAMLLLTVLHEIIHGLTWGFFAKGRWNAIAFGVIWKMLSPYCTCTEPLTKGQYIAGTVMPTLILGFGLSGIAVSIGNFGLFALSEVMIFCGGGDFLIILKVLLHKCRGREVLYYDHPYECGVVAFEKE